MFKNYLVSALRFLKRNKLFTGINLIGLSLAFMIAVFVVLLTVLYHSFRGSRINPIEALRYE